MNRFFQSLSLLFLVASIFLLSSAWPHLPPALPTHLGFTGQPDNFGPRNSILILPTFQLALTFFLYFASTRPHWINVPFPIDRSDPGVRNELERFINCLNAALSLQFMLLLDRFLSLATPSHKSLLALPFWLVISFPLCLIPYFLLRLRRSKTSVIN